LVDTRAYFTAATCAISLLKILSVNTSPKFFSSKNNIETKNVAIYDEYSKFKLNKKSFLTKIERDYIILTNEERSIIIGLLLSDAWLQKRKGWNPRVGFKQSIKNLKFLWNTFLILSKLCSSFPVLINNLKKGKLFFGITFQTRQLKCLNEIYTILYEDNKKTIKLILFDYIDYIVLAYWIMGDGAKRNKGIILCTDNFTLKEVILLMNILIIKFDLECTIHNDGGKYRIFINKKSLNNILAKIKPYFEDHFLYKIS
jgi:hypothetical protein